MKTVFCAALATETNTFGPLPTEERHFEEWFLYRSGEHPNSGPTLFTAPLWVARQRAKELNWNIVEGLCAAAFPSGRTTKNTYEGLRDELLEDLRTALPVDIVLLGLHGAMAADGYDDCEGDLLEKVRSLVGDETVIAAELDPHCHLTRQMVDAADLLLAFHDYPHTDAEERAERLIELAHRTSIAEIAPVTAVSDARMSTQFFTKVGPGLALTQSMKAHECASPVLAASLGHSFASGDVADMTVQSWVITDGCRETAIRVAEEIRDAAWAIKETSGADRADLNKAVNTIRSSTGLVVLAEGADNPGGGAPCDATDLIRDLWVADIGAIAAGPIWDPIAVDVAIARGEGAKFDLRVGGKASVMSGTPLDLSVEVLKVTRGATQSFGGSEWPMGDMVGIRAGNLELALTTVRNQAFTPEIFEQTGIAIDQQKVLVLKSNHHFYDAFAPLAETVLYMGTPGVAVCDPLDAKYSSVRRPLWPLDPENDARAAQSTYVKTPLVQRIKT